MRVPSLLPLLTVTVLAGCATESPQPSSHETAFRGAGVADPARDLTLQARAMPAVEVASPVELSRPAPEAPRRASTSRKPVAAPATAPVPVTPPAELPVPASSEAVAAVATEEAPGEEVAPGAGQELAPGKTVTVIPASSGPSAAPAEPSWIPSGPSRSVIIEGGGGGGGKCRPRGGARGIGIAGRIPHGVPGLRLR